MDDLPPSPPAETPQLRRVLRLRDLVFYGIVLITPIAPVGIFGVACTLSNGHVATTLLVAMVAMLLTALSYGRMAALYPTAGSAYTYVGKGLNAHLGFLAGWMMILDYLLIPVINTAYVALTIQRLTSAIPYPVLAALAAGGMTLLNLRGIRSTVRANLALLAAMSVVIGAFLVAAVHFLLHSSGWPGLLSVTPFYHPDSFHLSSIATATSLAALTYIGFDGVSTLAEEVDRPEKNISRATVLVCLITGLLSTLEVYLAQRVWPDYRTFLNPETAFLDVTGRAGGALLFSAMAIVLIVSCFGSGLTGQVGAARVLFGMGRDGVLPKRFFGSLNPKTGNPDRNVLLLGLLAYLGAVLLSWEHAVEMLNFGAFISFMGVNGAVIYKYYIERHAARLHPGFFSYAVLPALGLLFCFGIWISLRTPAKVAGGIWLLAGLGYLTIRTRGFRLAPAQLDLRER
jgi:putrescine importer